MKLAVAIATAAASLASDGGRSVQVAFKSGVELVRVDVLVTRDGAPVSGLQAADFEITDNSVRQTVDHLLSSADPIDVVLALDSSGSLDQAELGRLADAVRLTIDDLKPGDRAGLLTFADELTELVPLTDKYTEARSAVDRLHSSGATTLIDATYAALVSSHAQDRRLLALIFTDGMDTWSWLEPRWVLEVARRSAAVVYTVELRETTPVRLHVPGSRGGHVDPQTFYRAATRFLTDITDATGGRRFDADDISHLQVALRTALAEFRQRYVIAYAPQGVAMDGWHSLEVRVKQRGVTVRARPGYSR